MQLIQDSFNKIKWDKRENPNDYKIFYHDRILNKLIKIPYTKIKKLEGSFMVLDNENLSKQVFGIENSTKKSKNREIFNNEEESNIPLHRIKKVAKSNAVVWERK